MPALATCKRIGIFGGAFDPPHLAHVALLQSAISQLALDRLQVIPTGDAWHKPRQLTDAAHRIAMAQLAFGDISNVVVDLQETTRTGPSYTIDTLRSVAGVAPLAQLFLILGADQAAALTSWHAWQDILKIATICVADRTDSTRANTLFPAQEKFPDRFLHLRMPVMDLSATQIRAAISSGQPVNALVSNAVARYIDAHHLYQSN
jgi:nicotinate-nucleotide adenylyltransferase